MALGISLTAISSATDFYEAKEGPQPEHLVPIDYPPDDYDQRIASHLFVTDGRHGRFVIRPAFDAESCLSVHADENSPSKSPNKEDIRFIVTLTKPSESLYYSMAENNDQRKTRNVRVSRIDREISREMAIAIQRAWARMLQNTR